MNQLMFRLFVAWLWNISQALITLPAIFTSRAIPWELPLERWPCVHCKVGDVWMERVGKLHQLVVTIVLCDPFLYAMCLSATVELRELHCARIGLQCWALLSLRITSSREYGLCEGLWSGICETHSNVSYHSFARSSTSSSTQIFDGLQVRTRQLWGKGCCYKMSVESATWFTKHLYASIGYTVGRLLTSSFQFPLNHVTPVQIIAPCHAFVFPTKNLRTADRFWFCKATNQHPYRHVLGRSLFISCRSLENPMFFLGWIRRGIVAIVCGMTY